MKRPWRRVVQTETWHREQCCRSCYPKGKEVKLRRLHLECGHYYDVRWTPLAPRRRRCHICQTQKSGPKTMPIVLNVVQPRPAEHIELKFTIMPTGAKFEDVVGGED